VQRPETIAEIRHVISLETAARGPRSGLKSIERRAEVVRPKPFSTA
jgi:hypothetical protein